MTPRNFPFAARAICPSLFAPMETEKSPLLVGLRAARANLVPGLIVQAAMVALVGAYYYVPATHTAFGMLAEAKRSGGVFFTIIASALAGGVLPEVLTVVFLQSGKCRRENVWSTIFSASYWAFDGLLVDMFYRVQNLLFGTHVDVATVVKKMLFDQFVFSPFLIMPTTMACYEWKSQGYSFAGLSRVVTLDFYKHNTFPAMIAGWCIWIPLVSVIYSLPPLLQIPLFILALTFWVMIISFISNAQKVKTALPISAPAIHVP